MNVILCINVYVRFLKFSWEKESVHFQKQLPRTRNYFAEHVFKRYSRSQSSSVSVRRSPHAAASQACFRASETRPIWFRNQILSNRRDGRTCAICHEENRACSRLASLQLLIRKFFTNFPVFEEDLLIERHWIGITGGDCSHDVVQVGVIVEPWIQKWGDSTRHWTIRKI